MDKEERAKLRKIIDDRADAWINSEEEPLMPDTPIRLRSNELCRDKKLNNSELQKMVEVALNNTISISLIYAHNTDHIQQTLTALRDEVARLEVEIMVLKGRLERTGYVDEMGIYRPLKKV